MAFVGKGWRSGQDSAITLVALPRLPRSPSLTPSTAGRKSGLQHIDSDRHWLCLW